MSMKYIKLTNFSKIFYSASNKKNILFQDQDIVFESGRNIGLLGMNGCGKTTLMKIISKSESLSEGVLDTNATISWPIGVYAGLDPFLTGRQNIIFVSSLLGIKDIDGLIYEVATQAELEESMDLQVRYYSSGMFSRLSFFLCMLIEFDFYLIDEVTSVGDFKFQEKSSQLLNEVSKKSTIILTSHNPENIRANCDVACVIKNGIISKMYEVDEAIHIYNTQ